MTSRPPAPKNGRRRPLFDPGSIAAIHFADGRDAIDAGRRRPDKLASQAAASAPRPARCGDRGCAAPVRWCGRAQGCDGGAPSPFVGEGAPPATRRGPVGRAARDRERSGRLGRVQGPVAEPSARASARRGQDARAGSPGTSVYYAPNQASTGAIQIRRSCRDAFRATSCTHPTSRAVVPSAAR